MDTSHVVGLRDRAIPAVLVYTGSRTGAVAKLKRGNFYRAGDQWMLHFEKKGGKSREIPVRHDLQEMISAYIDAAGLREAPKNTPLFQSALKKKRRLSGKAIHVNDICRMMKRRLTDFAMPLLYSPHSFRVSTITELLGQSAQGGRAALGRTRRPAHYQPLRPLGAQDQKEHRRLRFPYRSNSRDDFSIIELRI